MRWGTSAPALQRYSRRVLPLIVALLMLLWVYSTSTPNPGRFRGNTSMNFAFWVMAASVLITPVLDFLSISAALNSISGEVSAGRWDLLRMTLLRPAQIVAAKHGAAQVRVWRPTILLVGVRIAASLMLALTLLRPLLFGAGFLGSFGRGFGSPLAGDPLLTVIALAVFCLEPLWRMSALTALGVAISTRAESRGATALLAVVAAVGFWIGELLLVAVFASIISTVNLLTNVFAPLIWVALMTNGLLASLFVTLIFAYLSLVQIWSLNDAARQISRAN